MDLPWAGVLNESPLQSMGGMDKFSENEVKTTACSVAARACSASSRHGAPRKKFNREVRRISRPGLTGETANRDLFK